MPVREGPPQPAPPRRDEALPPSYPADKARGGEITLRTPIRRYVFIGGLILLAVVVFLLLRP